MDFLMEFYFRGLTGKQTQKAYDFATKEFKAEINAMHVEQYKLEVFFSKYRLVMWLRLGEAGSAGLRKKLAGAVGVLLRKFAESLPEVWARVNGMATLTDNGFLPVQFGTMQSKPVTRVGTAHIPLRNAHHYWREMGKRKVLVDNGQREKEIRAMLSQAAAQAGGEVVSSPIMNDVVMTAERPVLNVITVDEKYINLPETLLTIILDRNLCFAIRSPEGRLLSTVLYISNAASRRPRLAADLARAEEKFAADLGIPISLRQQWLRDMLCPSGLGSMLEKQMRLQKIALAIAEHAEAGENVCAVAREAAELAKLDLTTEICQLYPEFSGYMGALIARHNGVEDMVASAIVEHWGPGRYSRGLPHTLVGALLAIADRLDDICGHYYQSEFRLSHYRAVKTWFDEIIAILDSVALDVSLTRLLRFSLSLYESQGLVPWQEKDLANLLKVFVDRLYWHLVDRDFAEGVASALTAINPDNVYSTMQKAIVLKDENNCAMVENCKEACRLLDRICAREYSYQEAAREYFEQPEEKELFEAYLTVRQDAEELIKARDFAGALARLARLKTPLLRFVNSVDLDTEDKPVRYNRLSLLAEIRRLYHAFADFSML